VLECVINVSEGRDAALLEPLDRASGSSWRNRHSDVFHNRSVFTLIAEAPDLESDVRTLIDAAFGGLDLANHEGVHPRFGVVDVVPFVALDAEDTRAAIELRDRTGEWIAATYDVPVFFYGALEGTVRTLPEVRRRAFGDLAPDLGPPFASSRLGAVACGQRPILLAWNLWLEGVDLGEARAIAASLRRNEVRSLAFAVGDQVQVSCNLIEPMVIGPDVVYDQVLARLRSPGRIERAELVGLAPRVVLDAIDPSRWAQLDLSEERTIEARLARR
jgi:glutamate formiminotransferase